MNGGYIVAHVNINQITDLSSGVKVPGLFNSMKRTNKPIFATISIKNTNSTTCALVTYSTSPASTDFNCYAIINGSITHLKVNQSDTLSTVE